MSSQVIPITVPTETASARRSWRPPSRLSGAGARIKPEVIEIGEKVYLRGISTGIEPSAWESLRRTRVFLKAPITSGIQVWPGGFP